MNRLLILAMVCATALIGCKKGADGEETAAEPTTAAKPADDTAKPPEEKKNYSTQEAKLERFKECWGLFEADKAEEFAGCYADATDFQLVDQTPEVKASDSKGAAAIAAGFHAGFPDLKTTPQLVLVNGSNFAALHFQTGTNSGELMGMPATNKKIGMFVGQVGTVDDNGKITRDLHWGDQMSLLKQLGVLPKEAGMMTPDALEKGWDTPIEVLAKDDDTERENVEAVKATLALVEKGDADALAATWADDIVFHYVAGNEGPKTGKKAVLKTIGQFFAMSSERKFEATNAWGASDWVVVESTTTLKLAIDFGKAKTKGKSSSQHELHFFQLSEGKLKQHIVVSNDMYSLVQLGVIDPAAMAAKGDPAKGDDK